ncbi:hypothetical protein A3C86_00760 [Candidatus Kaiserbacteria bacterium RIFCSPHIGHO2_02_FULL_49_16]|uniref:DNA polymerase III delta N-terminal domain-containing protein n=2 Tax=Parcubacteria group TaxID=1794811 RepID=A0A0G1WFM1_9BACT|nr:MAG: hypothetical protein UY58_C0003G0002 [Candidatus Magasanikbacteria bacterium GW2011_GWA2_50_22]OGG58690.1 MAG: hypothetical protein A3C86_00760 [Candidatus Kaiserbacteria bacterium RIFCSPHIGHO2_02_FULL_49_16]
MLHFYSGTDTKKAREEMNKAIELVRKDGARIVRINDTNSTDDLYASLQGGGLFGEKHVFVIDGVSENEAMLPVLLQMLEAMNKSEEPFFVYEASPDANTRRTIEKYAETTKKFDAPKKEKDGSVFALANAMRRADKKALWTGYQRELVKGKEPEAIHGVLFWGAKDMLLKSREGTPENKRAKKLVAELAELPHESRRNNFPLEYALERFVLSVA